MSHHPPPACAGSNGITRLSVLAVAAGFTWLTVHTFRQRRRYETRLRQAYLDAATDPLTGLPNRRYVQQQLTHATIGMIALLDLDDFKQVNDTHGHVTGDDVLIAVANRLRSAAHGDDAVAARLAGDEFVLLWTRTPPTSCADNPIGGLEWHVERLLDDVAAPVDVRGLRLQVGISVGIAVTSPRLTGVGLLSAADAAMYEAKHATFTTATSTTSVAPVRVRLWGEDRAPAGTDRRARRDIPAPEPDHPIRPAGPTGHDETAASLPPDSPASTSDAHRVATEGTR